MERLISDLLPVDIFIHIASYIHDPLIFRLWMLIGKIKGESIDKLIETKKKQFFIKITELFTFNHLIKGSKFYLQRQGLPDKDIPCFSFKWRNPKDYNELEKIWFKDISLSITSINYTCLLNGSKHEKCIVEGACKRMISSIRHTVCKFEMIFILNFIDGMIQGVSSKYVNAMVLDDHESNIAVYKDNRIVSLHNY